MRNEKSGLNIVLIPDGNRRYAKKHHLNYSEIYQKSAEKVDMSMKFFLSRNDVSSFAVYGLSYDNVLRRSAQELDPVYKAQIEQYKRWSHDGFFDVNKIKVKFAGELRYLKRPEIKHGFPETYIRAVDDLEQRTKNNEAKKFYILIGYSGEKEIIRSLKKVVHSNPQPESIKQFLDVKEDMNIFIRTGGERRVSDILPLQINYSEIFFLKKLFPEIEIEDLENVLSEFADKHRNFGV